MRNAFWEILYSKVFFFQSTVQFSRFPEKKLFLGFSRPFFGLGCEANEARKGSREEEEEIGEIGVSAKKKKHEN